MYKTKVTNTSENNIILKEGNAGVYSVLGILKKDAHQILIVSPNATYREYWFAMDPGSADDRIVLTSDDCMEYKEVKIVEKDKNIGWEGTRRRKPEPGTGTAPFYLRIWRYFNLSESEEPDKSGDKGTEDKEDAESAEGCKEIPNPEQSQDRAGDKDAGKIESPGFK